MADPFVTRNGLWYDRIRSGSVLRRVARLYISNRAVADEVVQDTWLGVIQGLWAFEGRHPHHGRVLLHRARARVRAALEP